MAVTLDVRWMRADLKSFSKAARRFIHNHERLDNLEKQLANAVAEAKQGTRELQWSTDIGEGGPIRTESSIMYRSNEAARRRKLFAEITFKFAGALDQRDDNKLVIRSGGTRVKLGWDDTQGETLYHFDIHPNAPGHPMLHVQFDSFISEAPRLHSILAHPIDILEFTLMEVFQSQWRKHREASRFANDAHKYPSNQRRRILALFGRYMKWVDSDDPPLISLLTSPIIPLEFYPV